MASLMHPTFNLRGRQIVVDVPHFAFATAIVAWCVWFASDAWRAQADAENVILIVPAAIAAVLFYVFIAISCFKIIDEGQTIRLAARRVLDKGMIVKLVGTMALLGAFVAAAPWIGFDAASFVYVFAMLLLLGERRIWVLLVVPAAFAAIAVYGFAAVLSNPLPVLLFRDAL
jgi:hypothetical protein